MPAGPRKPAVPPQEPPYYEATQDLYLYNPESGTMPLLAYRAGERVGPDAVAAGGWAGKVKVPDAFAEQFGPPAGKE